MAKNNFVAEVTFKNKDDKGHQMELFLIVYFNTFQATVSFLYPFLYP